MLPVVPPRLKVAVVLVSQVDAVIVAEARLFVAFVVSVIDVGSVLVTERVEVPPPLVSWSTRPPKNPFRVCDVRVWPMPLGVVVL